MRPFGIAVCLALGIMFASGVASFADRAPTAHSVLDKVWGATGWTDVRTVIMSASTTLDGRYVTETIMMKKPDRFFERVRLPQQQASLSLGAIGSTIWLQGFDGKVRVADSGDKNIGLDAVSLMFSTDSWYEWTLEADKDYRDHTCFDLRTKLKYGATEDYLIDTKTDIPVASQVTVGGSTFSEEYRDMAQSGGALYARQIAIIAPNGETMRVISITSLDTNVPLDDSQFAPPTH
jgi:hypothetical protein